MLVAYDGRIIGKGFTQKAGSPHTEVMALRDAAEVGYDTRGATAYVTLEPCAYQASTGPCCDALVTAGIVKVVASLADPNPLVAGQGFARMRAAGMIVEVGSGATESRELNIGFFSRMVRGTPWVRLKAAASLDGTTALNNGASQWITSRAARADGHAWRGAGLCGVDWHWHSTGRQPRLDVREVPTPRQPHVVVVDSQLQTPPDANLFLAERDCYIYTAVENNPKQAALEARGAQVVHLPMPAARWIWQPCCATSASGESTSCT